MNEQQQHLTNILDQQKALISEIQELNNTIMMKREQFLKLEGVVEYFSQLGVTLEDHVPVEIADR
jgi:hypothetical protein